MSTTKNPSVFKLVDESVRTARIEELLHNVQAELSQATSTSASVKRNDCEELRQRLRKAQHEITGALLVADGIRNRVSRDLFDFANLTADGRR